MTDPRITAGGTVWIDGDAPSDAAPITRIWRDRTTGALAAAPAFLVDAGNGDLTISTTGPAAATLLDTTGNGVYDLTLLPTSLPGASPTMLALGTNILVI